VLVRAVVKTSALTSFLTAADDVAAGRVDPMSAWTAYEQKHAEVFAAYLRAWGSPVGRPAAAAAMARAARLGDLHQAEARLLSLRNLPADDPGLRTFALHEKY
jgi:hypothetical protein